MSFPGGKAGSGVYQRIINQIPPHDVYVEAFLGDGAILRRKRPAARNIAVEVNRSTAATFSGFTSIEVYNCDAIAWLSHTFGLHLVGSQDQAATAPVAGLSANGRLPTVGRACGSDAPRSTVAGSGDTGLRWFVYCDPPYLMSTRTGGRIYEHEMTIDQHKDLLAVIRCLPCMVAISGYHSSLYAEALKDWRHISFNAMTRGGLKREYLWMNYHQPEALHDYRYLGDNKRQRERISRKVRTWAAGLQRLPRLERQAILDKLPRDPDA